MSNCDLDQTSPGPYRPTESFVACNLFCFQLNYPFSSSIASSCHISDTTLLKCWGSYGIFLSGAGSSIMQRICVAQSTFEIAGLYQRALSNSASYLNKAEMITQISSSVRRTSNTILHYADWGNLQMTNHNVTNCVTEHKLLYFSPTSGNSIHQFISVVGCRSANLIQTGGGIGIKFTTSNFVSCHGNAFVMAAHGSRTIIFDQAVIKRSRFALWITKGSSPAETITLTFRDVYIDAEVDMAGVTVENVVFLPDVAELEMEYFNTRVCEISDKSPPPKVRVWVFSNVFLLA